jgi:hypothetical protein
VNWELCCSPINFGGFSIFLTKIQAQALCTKWVVRAVEGGYHLKRHRGYSNITWHAFEMVCLVKVSDGPVVYGTYKIRATFTHLETYPF